MPSVPESPDHAPRPVDRTRSAAALSAAFRRALVDADRELARSVVAEASDSGVSRGALYTAVVRPALAASAGPASGSRAPESASITAAVMLELVGRPGPGPRSGAGRAVVLSLRDHGIGAVDGIVAMDVLQADGWTVARPPSDGPLARLAELAREDSIELAVTVATTVEEALQLAPAITELRRLADPPVLLLADFSARDDDAASALANALGVDAVVRDPDALAAAASSRLPEPGRRRWGVRIARSADALVLAPTGDLDAISAGRLADVASTRFGTYARLVVDLRDLARIDASGAGSLDRWAGELPPDGVAVSLLADRDSRRRLAQSGAVVRLPVVDRLD